MNEIILNLIYPKPVLLIGLIALIFIDLLTGINKAKRAGELTTSRGLRNTIDKASSYFSLLLSVFIMVNLLAISDSKDEYQNVFFFSANGMVIGCVYIEIKSILENLIIINTKNGVMNDLANYILVPIHSFLILKLQSKKENQNG
jgi:Bacteriophage holin family